jgi:zinc/manganese transport system substrate-binding protein
MKKSKMVFMIVLLMASVTALASEKLRVVATYETYAGMARDVGGSFVEVTSLAGGKQDPHFVDPKPSFLVQLHKADALLLNGLELEVGFLPPLLQQSGNARIQPGAGGYVDLSRFVTPIEVPQGGADRAMGDVHPFGNPHYHLDPRNMALVAKGIAGALARLDPAHRADYEKNGEALSKSLLALDDELARDLAPLKGVPVVTYHSSMDYFFARYGIPIAAFVEPKPGIKPSPASLLETEKRIREKGVRVVVTEPYQDVKIAQKVAADTGVKLVTVPDYTGGNPGAETYPSLLRTIAKALLGASHGG